MAREVSSASGSNGCGQSRPCCVSDMCVASLNGKIRAGWQATHAFWNQLIKRSDCDRKYDNKCDFDISCTFDYIRSINWYFDIEE